MAITYEFVWWERLYELCFRLYQKIVGSGFIPDVVVGIARGGWIPARILSDLFFTKETANLLDQAQFNKMKKGVFLINTARGGIINEDALYQAIQQGIVAGAAIDAFKVEPPFENPLLKLEQVVPIPHLGAATKEAQKKVSLLVAQKINNFISSN